MQNIYKAVVEQSPVLIWRSGKDGLCNFFNKTWLDFRGRTMEQEIGNGWVEGVHKDDVAFCMETYLGHFKANTIFEMTYRLQRCDGEYRYILDRGCPFYNDESEFLGYIGSCIDVTEKHQLQQEKEKIYQATIRGTNHILRNMLNQFQFVNLICEEYPTLYKTIEHHMNSILKESDELISKLSNVEEISEEKIIDAVFPKKEN